MVKTGLLSGMTGRAVRGDENRERIAIAIDENSHHALGVAGCLALVPQTRTRTRPEPDFFCIDSSFEALGIHVSERQHLERVGILNNRRNETSLIKFHFLDRNLHLTITPRSRK